MTASETSAVATATPPAMARVEGDDSVELELGDRRADIGWSELLLRVSRWVSNV
jgi:hypothetical protein